MTTASAEQSPVTMLDRVSSLLDAFDGHGRLTLAQLARKANLPRSSVHRILQHLVDLGWIERHGFEYALGLRMFEFGALVVRDNRFHRAAAPIMRDLHLRTGLSVYLSVLRGADVLHIERIGDWPDGGEGWHVGDRQPACHAAPGRALLARLDPAARPGPELSGARTPYSVRTSAQLEHELRKVRDHGAAVDMQGLTVGVVSVAAAIGPAAQAPAALTITGPASTMQPNHVLAQLLVAAADIWSAATEPSRPRMRQPSRPRPDQRPAAPLGGPPAQPPRPRHP
ncbi:IclR family transcriptional regulator [Spirillospora sp. NPDC029432]|uniref:IclR family transcriptional regulator n=1 Tax=Spirillospora sp. NPDC029432 TaxID=3154599 RepID=UPI0034546A26